MIDLPDLHGRSSSKEQAGAVSFYSWRKAAVLPSLHTVLFMDSTQFRVSSSSCFGQFNHFCVFSAKLPGPDLKEGNVSPWSTQSRESPKASAHIRPGTE